MSNDIAKTGIPMDGRHGPELVAAARHRLHGADRSGLGDKGWAEVPGDLVGHPDDTNVPPEFFEPAPPKANPDREH